MNVQQQPAFNPCGDVWFLKEKVTALPMLAECSEDKVFLMCSHPGRFWPMITHVRGVNTGFPHDHG